MENPPSRHLTLFTETGVVKSISKNKLILDSERAGLIDIYVPDKIPCAPNDRTEVTFELTEHGFIGRRVGTLPILPIDFLILSEYLRIAFISLIIFIGFLIIGLIFPVYFLSIILPVLLGFFTLYYYGEAFAVGRNVPNYNRATISPISTIKQEQYSQFFVKGASPPLIRMDGTLKIAQGTPVKGFLLHGDKKLSLISPVNPHLKIFNNLEGSWIAIFREDQIDLWGKLERGGNITWTLNRLLSLGSLFEIIGYLVFFLSVIPGFFIYGFGAPVPFSGDLLTSLFISCMFAGCCLIFVGKIANLKKRRIQNNIIVDYK